MPEPIVQTGDIDKSYQWAINTCKAPNVGYGSYELRNQVTVNGITYYDCSSFIWYALHNGGFINIGPPSFTTYVWSMQTILPNAGFTEYNAGEVEWLPGDILLGLWGKNEFDNNYDYQHTEMVYEGTGNIGEGYLMGAHGRRNGTIPLADQVSIRDYLNYGSVTPTSTTYTKLYRFGNGAGGYGMSLTQVAAILGNAYAESKVNPGCFHQNTGQYSDLGAGLWMWTNLGNMRIADQMQDWVADNYQYWYDGDGQVAFFFRDIVIDGGVEKSMWIQNNISQLQWMNTEYPTFQSFLDDKTETDLDKMCDVFFVQWETPGNWQNYQDDYQRRRNAAHLVYNWLLEHGNDPRPQDWYYELGHVFIPDDKAMQNCLLFWKIASAGGGGGGTQFVRKRLSFLFWLRRKSLYNT